MSVRAPYFIAGGGLVLLGGMVRLGFAFLGGGTPDLPPVGSAPIAETPLEPFAPRSAQWGEPLAQSGGEDWVFEVFTPPIIYFNPETAEFVLTPPNPRATPLPFGVEVTKVSRELYRLQYAGHVGDAGRYRIEVRDLESGAFYSGKVGESFPEANFSFLSFEADRRLVQPEDPDATPYVERVVRLGIRDDRLGETVELGLEPRYGDRAVVTLTLPDGTTQTLLPGASVSVEDLRYRVASADFEAESATLEKIGPDGAILETKTFLLTLESAPGPNRNAP